jgi:hypothetical protein
MFTMLKEYIAANYICSRGLLKRLIVNDYEQFDEGIIVNLIQYKRIYSRMAAF